MNSQGEQFPIANPSLVLREEFDDWAILFDPETGNAYGLNPVGVFIYKRLNGWNTFQDIVVEIQKHCTEVPDEVAHDVETFIQQLIEKGYAGYEIKKN